MLKDWLEGLSCTLLQGSVEISVQDVIYDSRKAAPNTVFVCMKGSVRDSHEFIPDVLKAGCRALVVERGFIPSFPLPQDVTVLEVENGRRALALLAAARFGHPLKRMTAIAVTGTKGKTTTTHMICSVLEHCGKKVGMIGTNGVRIGSEHHPTKNTTPESYELQQYFAKMAEAGCTYVVMEVSSQGVKMHRVDGIHFDYAIFTNISPDHIGPNEHADFAEYLSCKAELFQHCDIGFFNADDAHSREIMQGAACESHTFGLEQPAEVWAEEPVYLREEDFVGLSLQVRGRQEFASLKVGIPGRFNAYNALAALSLCEFLNLPEAGIREGMEAVRVNGRMEIVYSCDTYSVLVDYAHNAVSMESLLKTLRQYQPKRLVCVFGCGGNRAKERRYSMGEIGGALADLCIVTADNSRFEKVEDIVADIEVGLHKSKGRYQVILDRREAIFAAIRQARQGDIIAVIGKGHEDYQEICGVRHPFLDSRVILEAVEAVEKEREQGKEGQ
ncbi:MAG: UDP-N-acetylmuramoyl-L-alanyl-D-glutamate--2,6-diaminopimelate ligase [bacterium]|nr:UDP-N-acetylmuramoyl-L-alanyl-D-glutamate--2,6-diaminopimelate ligase [bacterium]